MPLLRKQVINTLAPDLFEGLLELELETESSPTKASSQSSKTQDKEMPETYDVACLNDLKDIFNYAPTQTVRSERTTRKGT